MPNEIGFLSAFLVGLLGGVHCAGMCGGIVGALTLGLPEPFRLSPQKMLPFQIAYNSGRLISYVVAGALMGGIGVLAANLAAVNDFQRVLQGIAALFMLALGLYLAGWWQGLTHIERLGGHLWKRIEPLSRNLMPVRTPMQAFWLGTLWGWLPCGLVYSVLVWCIAAGSALQGGGLMLAFGLGTVPTLLTMGLIAGRVMPFVRSPATRQIAGAMVAGFGLWSLWLAIS